MNERKTIKVVERRSARAVVHRALRGGTGTSGCGPEDTAGPAARSAQYPSTRSAFKIAPACRISSALGEIQPRARTATRGAMRCLTAWVSRRAAAGRPREKLAAAIVGRMDAAVRDLLEHCNRPSVEAMNWWKAEWPATSSLAAASTAQEPASSAVCHSRRRYEVGDVAAQSMAPFFECGVTQG